MRKLILLMALGAFAYPLTTFATSDARPEEPDRTQQQRQVSETQQAEDANSQMSDVPVSKERKRDLKRQFKKVVKEVKAKLGPNYGRGMPGWGWLYIISGALFIGGIIIFFASATSGFGFSGIGAGLLAGYLMMVLGSLGLTAAFIWMLVDLLG